ncbi:MAG: hypothetical protein IR153_06810 [Flavobacterium sp.]|nr:hypothetical protein [Flavobacterium sp.]
MENIFNSKFRKQYLNGYVFGQNPIFLDFEDLTSVAPQFNNEAFLAGFKSGRRKYERINGLLENGIPENILTDKDLDEYLLAGELGMPLEAEGYTELQMSYIIKYYRSGSKNYNSDRDIALYSFLSDFGIEYSQH